MEQNMNTAALTPEELEARRKQALKVLENSYDMYELSRAEAIEKRKNKVDKDGNRIYTDESLAETLELMDTMQSDIIEKYVQLGGDPEDLKKRKPKKRSRKKIEELSAQYNGRDELREYSKRVQDEAKTRERNKYVGGDESDEEPAERKNNRKILENVKERSVERVISFDDMERNNNNTRLAPETSVEIPEPVREPQVKAQPVKQNMNFDEVSLPSKGECYPTKMDKIRVSHLVAYDENLILSPGLYKNGTFLDHILKNKILDNVDPDDLIQGDRDAIIIWLRAGGYGPMYPIKVTDEKSGEEFETQVDLSELSFRPFTLKGDENGHFDFTLPVSGDKLKFKFLTAGDAKRINKMREQESEATQAGDMRDKIRDIVDFLDKSEKFSSNEKDRMIDDINDIEDAIYQRYKDVEDPDYTHDMTNRLIISTVSVNGITDRKYVANYITNMNLKDASEYRKYMVDNEPGMDYNIKVKRPDSLGGGYIETFLQLDQFIFVY